MLDIGGVGDGKVQDLTHEILRRGRIVHEVDLVKAFLVHPNFHATVEDILETEFPPDSFDAVIAVHVLQHVGRRWKGLTRVHDNHGDHRLAERICNWLKPGGVVFIEVPVASEVQEIIWDSSTSWKVYTLEELRVVFRELQLEGHLIYDGATDSKKRIPGAKSAVVMLRKP